MSNTGSILLAAQGIGAPSVDNASAIDITFSGQDANATITNTGTITLSGSGSELLLLSDASGGLTTLNLNNGSVVDASDAQLADGSGYQGRLIVNANNGSRHQHSLWAERQEMTNSISTVAQSSPSPKETAIGEPAVTA